MSAPQKKKSAKTLKCKDFAVSKKAILSDIKQEVLKLQEKADRKLQELTCMCKKEEESNAK